MESFGHDSMKKILFFIPALCGGGAERVFIHIMNNLSRERFSMQLALLQTGGQFMDSLHPDIEIHDLKTNIAGSFLKVPRCINRVNPDIVFSTICYMNMVVGFSRRFARKPDIFFCARESGMPSVRVKVTRSVWNAAWLYRRSYPHIDRIVCQSDEMRDDVHARYGVPLERIATINNPVDIEGIGRSAAAEEPRGFLSDRVNIVTAGRMKPVKGFDMLLEAMKRTSNPRLHLHLLGEGGLEGDLKRLAKSLGIEDRVTFHGFVQNPYTYMRAADLFVMSSIYEGFPNAMLEALSLGCPALAFDCPGGIKQLIEPGINGNIVPFGDVDGLAREMDGGKYLELDRGRIAERIAGRYGMAKIIGEYEELLDSGAARE